MCNDPLVQKCMCPTFYSRMHAEKHYLFLPYCDIKINPNNIKIVVRDTSESQRKSLDVSSRKKSSMAFYI